MQLTIFMRQKLNLVAMAVLVAIVSGCSQEPPVSIAIHPWIGYQTVPMALDRGWIDKSQVDLVTTASSSNSMQLMRDGRVDAAAITLDEAVRLCAEGMDISVILVFNISDGADVVLSRYDLNRLKEMETISIAFEETGLGSLMFNKMLKATGLERAKFSIVNVTSDKHSAFWIEHQPDMLITYEPTASSLQNNQKAIRITDTHQMQETVFDVLAVKKEALESSPDIWAAVVSGQYKAVKHFMHNRGDFLYRLEKFSGIEKVEVEEILRDLILPNAEYSAKLFAGNPSKIKSVADEIHMLFVSDGIIKATGCRSPLLATDLAGPHASK